MEWGSRSSTARQAVSTHGNPCSSPQDADWQVASPGWSYYDYDSHRLHHQPTHDYPGH